MAPASFMPVLFIVLPTLFILPFHRNYSLIFFFEVIYVILVFLYKSPDVGQYDIFDSVVGLAFSFSVAQPTMRLRIQDHETRMNYRQLSQQDSLSGLLNKTTSQEHLERYLQLTAPSTVCTMLILDLDDFKAVNDTMGHYTGDLLLRTMGEVLVSSFRTTDMIGRFGGDEFIVLMKETADYTLLEENARVFINSCRKSLPISAVRPRPPAASAAYWSITSRPISTVCSSRRIRHCIRLKRPEKTNMYCDFISRLNNRTANVRMDTYK